MNTLRRLPLQLFALVLASASARAAGYALFQGSARGNVDSATLIANGGEPGALYFNPAAITDCEGLQTQVGFTMIRPRDSIRTRDPYTGRTHQTEGHRKTWPIPSAYFTAQLDDSLWLGLGFYTRFGLGAELHPEWPGRYNSYYTAVESFDIAPVLAWKVNDRVSVAGGLTVRYFTIELKQRIDAVGSVGLRRYNDPAESPYDVDQVLEGDCVAFGGDLGVIVKASDDVSLGLSYHSRTRLNVSGKAKWTVPDVVRAYAPGAFQNTDLRAKSYTPDEIMGGVHWRLDDDWSVSAAVVYTLWSVYDSMSICLDEPMYEDRRVLVSEKAWHDTWRFSLGLGWRVRDDISLYAGYTFDGSPLNSRTADYFVPADDRHIVGLGATWNASENWTWNFSAFYERVMDKDVRLNQSTGTLRGKYCDGRAYALAFSCGYKF